MGINKKDLPHFSPVYVLLTRRWGSHRCETDSHLLLGDGLHDLRHSMTTGTSDEVVVEGR